MLPWWIPWWIHDGCGCFFWAFSPPRWPRLPAAPSQRQWECREAISSSRTRRNDPQMLSWSSLPQFWLKDVQPGKYINLERELSTWNKLKCIDSGNRRFPNEDRFWARVWTESKTGWWSSDEICFRQVSRLRLKNINCCFSLHIS